MCVCVCVCRCNLPVQFFSVWIPLFHPDLHISATARLTVIWGIWNHWLIIVQHTCSRRTYFSRLARLYLFKILAASYSFFLQSKSLYLSSVHSIEPVTRVCIGPVDAENSIHRRRNSPSNLEIQKLSVIIYIPDTASPNTYCRSVTPSAFWRYAVSRCHI